MDVDVAIIGAGLVGLATAYQVVAQDPSLKVCVVEKEKGVAAHQSGHNSGVIHSGIYYKPGSAKAHNCRRGYDLLRTFCDQEGIRYDCCGKVIVATEEAELPILENIYERGLANGLTGLQILDREALEEKEPHVVGLKAIWVPQAGIIDYKEVAATYAQKIQAHGAEILFKHEVKDLTITPKSVQITTPRRSFGAKLVVNCAGLYADKIAQMTQQPDMDMQILPFRGEYYELKPAKTHLVQGLIYPVPNPNFPFLGVHFTRMIGGGVEAGPNAVLAFRREGYRKSQIHLKELLETITYSGFAKIATRYWRDGLYEMYRSFSKAAFVKALQKLVPVVTADDLTKGGAGVRAQACTSAGTLVDDFLILEQPQVINVCNAPSPAATASLAIGETIAQKIISKLT